MIDSRVFRVILAYKRKLVKKLKRRSAKDRLKSRLYYKKNKRQLMLKRKRYLSRNKPFLGTRKLYKRSKPAWYSKHKQKQPTSIKPKKPTMVKPKKRPAILKKKPSIPKPRKRVSVPKRK